MPMHGEEFGHGLHTEEKQQALELIASRHTSIAKNMMAKHGGRYVFFDMNAGPGYTDTGNGSSQTAPVYVGGCMRVLPILLEQCSSPSIVLCEVDPARHAQLTLSVAAMQQQCERAGGELSVLLADHSAILPAWAARLPAQPRPYGLIYHDPDGIPNFSLLGQVFQAPHLWRVDVLIHFSGTNLKRHRRHGVPPLAQQLAGIRKRYWLIREDSGWLEWSFVIGTNWPGFPVWKKEGFHGGAMPTFAAVFDKLNLTRQERHTRSLAQHQLLQPRLPGLEEGVWDAHGTEQLSPGLAPDLPQDPGQGQRPV